MITFNIISAWGSEPNPYANTDTANNGGGYSQLDGGCIMEINGDLLCVEVADTSCGDFGSRISVDIDAPAVVMRWLANFGSMSDASIDAPEEINAIADSILGVTGLDLFDLVRAALDAARTCAYASCGY